MKTNRLIVLCIVVVIAAFLIVAKVGNNSQNSQNNKPLQTAGNMLSPQTNSEGSVSITVTPQILGKGKSAQFDVTFTTHMGSLDFDLLQITKLVDDKGTLYKPLSWSGGKGGHHLSGTLLFPSLSEKANKVTLTLSSIDNMDRVFNWDLK